MKKKRIHDGVPDSDDSTSGSDNNNARLQHNKGMIASLQFWRADLDPVTLGRATEQVYTTFFYSPSSHTLCQQSDEILFGCFMITLNAAFDQQLSLVDEGYESGSEPWTYLLH